ncbi:MAG: GNAT family N-acetyltransferase [Halobacteriota archaeon]
MIEDAADLDVYAVVTEHDPPDRDGCVHIGGGFVTIKPREQTVEELPDGGFGVVDEAWRGLGLGRRLFEKRVQWARDQDVDIAFAFGWEHPGRTSRPLFEDFGFVPFEDFDRLYEDERDACHVCGVWPSDDRTCMSGVVWAKDLWLLRVVGVVDISTPQGSF